MGLRWLVLAVIVVGSACSKAPAPATSKPSADASTKPDIPPFDDTCTTDTDCAATHVRTSGSELC